MIWQRVVSALGRRSSRYPERVPSEKAQVGHVRYGKEMIMLNNTIHIKCTLSRLSMADCFFLRLHRISLLHDLYHPANKTFETRLVFPPILENHHL